MSSYNDIIRKVNSSSLARYRAILNNTSLTSEQEGVNLISERINNLKKEIKDFNTLQFLTNENFNNVSNLFKFQIKDINILCNSLETRLNEYDIKTNTNQNNLVSLLKRIRQKINTLEIFSSNFKNVILEDFSTLQYILFNITENSQINVDKYAKVATLNISERPKEIRVSDIYIGSASNGLSGSYYDTDFANPLNIISSNANNYYEYFKLNDGPLILDLVFELFNEEILNEIRVLPQVKFSNPDFEIEDVIFTSKQSNSISIKKLIDTNEQTLKVRINEIETLNVYKFLPIKATRVSIRFVQKQYNFIDSNKVYSLALKSVSFLQNKYDQVSEMQGGTFSLGEGYYSLEGNISIFPKENIFYNHSFAFTKDNNSNWESYNLIDNKTPICLHDGKLLNLIYKYTVSRIDEAFSSNQTYNSSDYVLETFSKSKVINKEVSPVYISFNELFLSKSLKVIQPDIGYRGGDINKAIKLATLIGPTEVSIQLPISLNDYRIKRSELNIIVNGNKWLLETNVNNLEDGKFFLNSDNKTIKLKLTNPSYYNIAYLLSELMPKVHAKPEGYYIQINEPFDFDKNNINLKCLDSVVYTNTEIFPKGSESILLEKTFLNRKFLEIKDLESDTVYKIDDENFNSLFNINFLNGNIILLDESFKDKDLEISYQYYNFKKIENDKYDIWFSKDKVKGIFISPNDFPLRTVNETLIEEDFIFDVLSGGMIRNNKSSTNEKKFIYLKNKNIVEGTFNIKDLYKDYYKGNHYNVSNDEDIEQDAIRFVEVIYIDGKSEFMFLTKMDKDIVPSEDIKDNSISNWSYRYLVTRLNQSAYSSKKVYLYRDEELLGEIKESSNSSVESLLTELTLLNDDNYVGLYNNTTKICLLKFSEDSSVIENCYLSYWYINQDKLESENSFMYSLDYKNGLLHLNKPILLTSLNTINVNYKTSNFILNYSLCNELTKWNYNEENKYIELNTEELNSNINSKVKMIYGKSIDSYDLKGLENYFSPLIYKIKIGLN